MICLPLRPPKALAFDLAARLAKVRLESHFKTHSSPYSALVTSLDFVSVTICAGNVVADCPNIGLEGSGFTMLPNKGVLPKNVLVGVVVVEPPPKIEGPEGVVEGLPNKLPEN